METNAIIPRANLSRVLVIGDVIDDVIVRPRGTVRSNTDSVADIDDKPGGSAANTACWLGSVGAQVDFVGRVGTRDLERHLRELSAHGVTPHLQPDPNNPTGRIVILVDGNTRSMLTDAGANRFLQLGNVDRTLLDTAAIVHTTGYSLLDGRDSKFQKLVRRARARQAKVSLDPSSAGFISDLGPRRFLETTGGVDVFFPNEAEAEALTGLGDPEEAAKRLTEHFPLVILTCGRHGSLLASRGQQPVHIPAVPVDTLEDPTGAGDAFSAGFLAKWAAGEGVVAAARHGAVVASRAVTIVGGRPAPLAATSALSIA